MDIGLAHEKLGTYHTVFEEALKNLPINCALHYFQTHQAVISNLWDDREPCAAHLRYIPNRPSLML